MKNERERKNGCYGGSWKMDKMSEWIGTNDKGKPRNDRGKGEQM